MTFVLKGLLWRKGGASEHKHSALESPKKVGSEQVTNGRVWVGSSSSKMSSSQIIERGSLLAQKW